MMSPLLAFGFASPWLLWGLALGTAPILIHLLSRRRFRETQWAAMRFLLEAVRKNSRRLHLEQLLLLAVRTLLLLLLVLALAQPFVEQLGAFFRPTQPLHKIIAIDASLSMGRQSPETSLFDRARETARAIVEAARQGDAFNLVRLSNLPPAVIVPTPAFQGASVIEEIDQMTLPHGRGDLVASLQAAEELLNAVPELPQKEVYLISDFQRTTWTPDSADDLARLKRILRKFDEAGRLVLIDLGETDAANMAVTRVEAVDALMTISRPARFQATIHNFSIERVTGRVVEFLVDDRLVEKRVLEVAAGAEVTENFTHTFAAGGEHRVLVRLQKDQLPLDDLRWLSVTVRERLRVLCVNGRSASRTQGRATDFLELALSPGTRRAPAARGEGLHGRIDPVVVNEGELPSIDLNQYDCVFFCDVRMFTDREARQIEAYLRGGGGVVWCPGPNVVAEGYNQALYRGGEGILPAALGERIGDPQKRSETFTFDPADFAHPLVNAFQGNPDAGLETTQTYAYLRAPLPAEGEAKAPLRFDNGDPAIVEAPVGRGRSVLITTSVDDSWGVWPLWPSFLPLIHEIVQFAVGGRTGERQRIVGDPLDGLCPATAIDPQVSVTTPDGLTLPARVISGDPYSQYHFEGTTPSGIYEVQLGSPQPRVELFAVNVDPKESPLTKFVAEELSQELLPGIEHEYSTSWEAQAATQTEAPIVDRGGLTRWLLYAVLYLLFVEQTLAWDFRKGLWLLCPPAMFFERLTRGAR